MRGLLLMLVFVAGLMTDAFSREHPPKRELRAVWVATIGNIDWPSEKGLSAQQQQREFIQYLDFFQSCGFNAVIVQIRPAADAFYPSPYEPWSLYLSGKQGQPPFPKYDPLAFMIKETHQRNMEFHAWFNPFRALVNSSRNPNPPGHATRTHPEWIINYGGKSYFDPGNPEARNYILKVILDVVKRYDIDAVHIDDYFYPYYKPGNVFNDRSSYAKYSNGMSQEDWRRNNVNLFISQLNNQIKQQKPWVQFGVSPFGIWRNAKEDPVNGSATSGSSCYDDLYSDVLLWMDKDWVDYVAPQLYWPRSSKAASYSVLLPWWMQHRKRAKMYIGLGLYRLVDAKPGSPWYGTSEMLAQIRMARSAHAGGLVFYSASCFGKIGKAFTDSLRMHYFSTIAFPPTMPWLDKEAPAAPQLSASLQADGTMLLRWQETQQPATAPLKFAVYRFKESDTMDMNNPVHIIALTQGSEFRDAHRQDGVRYRYVVTALDRLWNESVPSNQVVQ